MFTPNIFIFYNLHKEPIWAGMVQQIRTTEIYSIGFYAERREWVKDHLWKLSIQYAV